MAECDVCGRHVDMPYNCGHCGGTHCPEHRLPENHDCPGLSQWNDPESVFDSGFDDRVNPETGSQSVLDRVGIDTGPGGVMGYFRNNMSFLFLAIMFVVFLLQFVVAPLVGVRTGGSLWRNIFTLNSVHPEYLWTWIISIFSHGSPIHLFGNAIVLYFFGPVVERQIGSKRFTALFLASGVLAGLAQVALGIVFGNPTFVLGASGAILAILGVITVLNPDLRVYLYFIIPMPIWVLTFGYAALSVFGVVAPGVVGGNIAHAAHLAGLLIGLAYGQRVKGRVSGPPGRLQFGRGGGGMGPGRGGGPGGRI